MLELSAIATYSAPGEPGVLANAVGWITGTLLGTVATTACIIAVALVGFSMLAGRLPVRQGARVVLGCFLLLGAPMIASAFGGFWQSRSAPAPAPPAAAAPTGNPRGDLPPVDSEPYAGASLRRD